eukprot:scaffold131139_cov39-Prasinocladus_malaysianus.AAC.2
MSGEGNRRHVQLQGPGQDSSASDSMASIRQGSLSGPEAGRSSTACEIRDAVVEILRGEGKALSIRDMIRIAEKLGRSWPVSHRNPRDAISAAITAEIAGGGKRSILR